MQVRTTQHEVGASLANFRTIDHEPEMFGLNMLASGLDTMVIAISDRCDGIADSMHCSLSW